MLRWLRKQSTGSWGTPPSPAELCQHLMESEAMPLRVGSVIFVGFHNATAVLRPGPFCLTFRQCRNRERLVNRPFTLTLQ